MDYAYNQSYMHTLRNLKDSPERQAVSLLLATIVQTLNTIPTETGFFHFPTKLVPNDIPCMSVALEVGEELLLVQHYLMLLLLNCNVW